MTEPKLVAKRPGECSERELDAFCSLVDAGGQVQDGLRDRIRQTGERLVFAYKDESLVAVGALKRPFANHHQDVFKRSKAEADPGTYPLELGWFVTAERHTRQGHSGRVARELIQYADNLKQFIFATSESSNEPMHKTLKRYGFRRLGDAYKSKLDDKLLWLFVRDRS